MNTASRDWATEFAEALQKAASDAVATRTGKQALTMPEFASVIRKAKHDIRWRRELSQYQIRFDESLTDAVNLLRRHPAVSQLIGASGRAEVKYWLSALHTQREFSGTERFLRGLVEAVLRFNAIHGEAEGVKKVDEALRLGTGRDLQGHEVTFFSGLVLESPWHLAPGLSLMPYELYRRQLDALARYTYDSCLGRALWQDEFGQRPAVAVLIRRFRWGPAFFRGEPVVPTDHDYEYGDRLLESDSLVDILSVFAELPFQIIAHHSRADQWFYDLLGDGDDLGCHYFRRSPVESDPGRGKGIAAATRRPFREVVELWAKFAEGDRKRARLVASRLSGALSRKGSLAMDDRILDVAIALEVLYSMTRRDKLASWAAVLLEDDKRDRNEIRQRVEALRDSRTAIVHDLREPSRVEPKNDVYSRGFAVARRSLLTHLNRGAFLSRGDRKLLDRGIRPRAGAASVVGPLGARPTIRRRMR